VFLVFWLVARAQLLQTRDGRTEAAPGDTAPLRSSLADTSAPVDPDSPPVTLKLMPAFFDGDYCPVHKRVLLITGCSDRLMWYANLIGQEVPYLGRWDNDKHYKSREPAGYVNIVKYSDAIVINKEIT
jgi:hypothetical protein